MRLKGNAFDIRLPGPPPHSPLRPIETVRESATDAAQRFALARPNSGGAMTPEVRHFITEVLRVR